MSNQITKLCRPLRIRPTPKCVLMALADRADDDGVAWPSLAWLGEWTCYGRRTIMEALDELERAGFIVLKREPGRPHVCQIVLAAVENACANPGSSRTGTQAGAAPVESGDSPENPGSSCTGAGAAPVQEPHHPPGSSRTGTQAGAAPPRAGAAPDTSIDTLKTSNKTVKQPVRAKAAFDARSVELPEWLPADTWAMWVRDRAERKQPVTEAGAKLQLRSLEKYLAEGHDPVRIIELAVVSGWRGLYPAKDGSTKLASAPKRERELVL